MTDEEIKIKRAEYVVKHKALKDKLKEAEKTVDSVMKEFDYLHASCVCVIVCSHCKHKVCECGKFGPGSAECGICGTGHGWYCPRSPDHICYYYTEEDSQGYRFIKMDDGSRHYMPNNYNVENEKEDSCLFCHHPEERN